jgi:hypothetical protein
VNGLERFGCDVVAALAQSIQAILAFAVANLAQPVLVQVHKA